MTNPIVFCYCGFILVSIGDIMKKKMTGNVVMVNNYELHVRLMLNNLKEIGLKAGQLSEETRRLIDHCEQPFHKDGKMFESIWED